MKRKVKKLHAARAKYLSVVSDLEAEIIDKVAFEFSIEYQPSDGFIILHLEDLKNASLESCLEVIYEKGVLTYGDYLRLTI
ncbi:hypothetical protein SAMN05216480_12333 [Pustulibacterium marinum]|uniref:Uncharacterized protein n=1 Tax=Pustulibacterium marinum TaxID=1224947 RepID=A0A1I7IWE1_9FLAO|nr:hypothetical protein [Pustulibacterium marinum]SFU77250.1 hypothetical protein SAMN05216480_12333 [Pustulibacterium marinum]